MASDCDCPLEKDIPGVQGDLCNSEGLTCTASSGGFLTDYEETWCVCEGHAWRCQEKAAPDLSVPRDLSERED